MIKHKWLTNDDICRNENIMREGNLALRECHDLVKKGISQQKYTRRSFRKELFHAMKESRFAAAKSSQPVNEPESVIVRNIKLPEELVKLITAVKDIETAMIEGFTRMVHRCVNKLINRKNGTYLDRDDFISHGFQGLLEAIYNYVQEVIGKDGVVKRVKFNTYAYWCVSRHIRLALNRKSNYPWTPQMRRLYERYDEAKRTINRSANIQEISDFLGFTDKEQRMLNIALTSIQNEEGLRPAQDKLEESTAFDYTSLALVNIRFRKCEILENDDIGDTLVSWLEAESMFNDIANKHGWKDDLAKKYGIRRQAPYETLRRLKSRLEHCATVKKFSDAIKRQEKPKIEDFVGTKPKGNKEKAHLWQKLVDELISLQKKIGTKNDE